MAKASRGQKWIPFLLLYSFGSWTDILSRNLTGQGFNASNINFHCLCGLLRQSVTQSPKNVLSPLRSEKTTNAAIPGFRQSRNAAMTYGGEGYSRGAKMDPIFASGQTKGAGKGLSYNTVLRLNAFIMRTVRSDKGESFFIYKGAFFVRPRPLSQCKDRREAIIRTGGASPSPTGKRCFVG